ncbi:MAG: DUF3575 domain-containing protein [Rikenellaceae bacterium]
MKLKLIFATLLTLLCNIAANAQEGITSKFYIEPKVNVAAACVGILNPAIEIGFGKRSAIEYSGVFSFAKDEFLNTGYPLLLSMNILEYRHYIKQGHKGLFLGADLCWDLFKIHKNLIPLVAEGTDNTNYDWGIGTTLGLSVGYKFNLTKKLLLELSASGGWRLTQHESYGHNGELLTAMNASGEWTAYKCGVYLSYRFK